MNKALKLKIIGSIVGLVALNVTAFYVILANALETVDVVVANETIGPRTVISEHHVKTIAIVKGTIDSNVYISREDILGKVVSFDSTIYAGSLFFKQSIEDVDGVIDAPLIALKPGQSAVSLGVDMIKSTGNTLLPGQYVDVVLTLPIRNKNPLVDVIFQQVRVLAIKDRYGYDMSDSKSQKVPHVVLLALYQEDVKDFYLAIERGQVHLVPIAKGSLSDQEATKNWESVAWSQLYE